MQTEPLLYEAYIATGKVVTVFRNLPIPELGHTNAVPAASAAYCAGQQDPKLFWQLHDWLFANQSAWSSAADAATQFRQQAIALGADSARYDACLKDAKTVAAIERDAQEAARLGLERGTPQFVLQKNNQQGQPEGEPVVLLGLQEYSTFVQKIEPLLAQTP